MATPSFGESEFVIGKCDQCEEEALTYLDLDPAEQLVRRCMSCNAIVASGFKVVDGTELESRGYAVLEARACGNGGGCGVGGCGSRARE